MPGWHAKTENLVDDGKLLVIGIAPEQHGDRIELFLQWKGMEEMPVLLDSYNLYRLRAVPITLLIDEAGMVRYRNPKDDDLAAFLAAPPAEVGTAPSAPRDPALVGGKTLFTTDASELAALLNAFDEASESSRATPSAHFQRGVAYRKYYDLPSTGRNPAHFEEAISSWRQALALDPPNYIWRRRLQQYGPRLDKPYPFYDWIATARRDLQAKGIEPHPLASEPTGAEVAHPSKQGAALEVKDLPHPDPDNQLAHDDTNILKCHTVAVPHTTTPERAVRVFVTLTPNADHDAKWNDEAGLSTVRLVAPPGWQATKPVVAFAPVPGTTGQQALKAPRQVEFELRRDREGGKPDRAKAAVFEFQLFYNVCYGPDRVCQIFRRDVTVEDPFAGPLEAPQP